MSSGLLRRDWVLGRWWAGVGVGLVSWCRGVRIGRGFLGQEIGDDGHLRGHVGGLGSHLRHLLLQGDDARLGLLS